MFVYSREPLGLTVGDTQGPQCKLKSVSGQQSLYWAKVLLVLSPHEAEEEGSQDLSVPRGFFMNWVCGWESCSGARSVTVNCEWLGANLTEAVCSLY